MKIVVLTGKITKQLQHVMLLEFDGYAVCGWAELNPVDMYPRSAEDQVKFIDDLLKMGTDLVFATHSEVALNAIRVAVFEDRISHENVEVRFYEFDDGGPHTTMLMDRYARFPTRPRGFFDKIEDQLSTLLRDKDAKPPGEWVPPSDKLIADIVQRMGRPNKIACIRQLRLETGLGLKEAKDQIEDWLMRTAP